jgi:hypothetical protein
MKPHPQQRRARCCPRALIAHDRCARRCACIARGSRRRRTRPPKTWIASSRRTRGRCFPLRDVNAAGESYLFDYNHSQVSILWHTSRRRSPTARCRRASTRSRVIRCDIYLLESFQHNCRVAGIQPGRFSVVQRRRLHGTICHPHAVF